MYSTILIPLDGSAFGERAIPVAVALARRSGAAIELVHVRGPGASGANAPMYDTRFDDEIEQQIRDRASSLADRLAREEGLAVRAVFLRGEIAGAIQEYGAGRGVDLVVMTTHGRGGFSRAWLGSVADEMVRHATAPLLLIRPDTEGSPGVREPIFRRVLVPLDGSSRGEEVLAHAAALGAPGDTEYLLLTVVMPRASVNPFPNLAIMLDRADLARHVEEERSQASVYLARIGDSFREIGARVTTHTRVHGQTASAILEFSREHAVDLIALSTRVRSATERVFVGSVADKVLRGTMVPLLICGPRLAVTASQHQEVGSMTSPGADPARLAR